MNNNISTLLTRLDAFFTEYLGKKAPAIPENFKEMIVKYGPYLVILGLLLSIGPIIALFGLNAMFAPLAAYGRLHYSATYYLSSLVLLVSLVINAIAVPGLLARKKSAWNLMYYAALVSALYSLISLNIAGLIIGTGITMYVLFQIRSYYKN